MVRWVAIPTVILAVAMAAMAAGEPMPRRGAYPYASPAIEVDCGPFQVHFWLVNTEQTKDRRVAAGTFAYKVEQKAKDEVPFLVALFNEEPNDADDVYYEDLDRDGVADWTGSFEEFGTHTEGLTICEYAEGVK